MKIILIILIFMPFLSHAQDSTLYVGSKKLKDVQASFIQGEIKNGLNNFYVIIDYGQSWNKGKDKEITNVKGERFYFDCIACVLNYLKANGWDESFYLEGPNLFLFKRSQ